MSSADDRKFSVTELLANNVQKLARFDPHYEVILEHEPPLSPQAKHRPTTPSSSNSSSSCRRPSAQEGGKSESVEPLDGRGGETYDEEKSLGGKIVGHQKEQLRDSKFINSFEQMSFVCFLVGSKFLT